MQPMLMLLTTSRFSREAIEYVGTIDSRVILIDGYELAKLMIEFNIGATVAQVYSVKTIDTDFFEE